MAKGAFVFAMANPNPEVHPDVAHKYAAVVATGRSDFPNQINNVLAFPGIFAGALAGPGLPDHRGHEDRRRRRAGRGRRRRPRRRLRDPVAVRRAGGSGGHRGGGRGRPRGGRRPPLTCRAACVRGLSGQPAVSASSAVAGPCGISRAVLPLGPSPWSPDEATSVRVSRRSGRIRRDGRRCAGRGASLARRGTVSRQAVPPAGGGAYRHGHVRRLRRPNRP